MNWLILLILASSIVLLSILVIALFMITIAESREYLKTKTEEKEEISE